MYIAYDVKNGVEYAKLFTSKRDGHSTFKDYCNLGRVLDKDRGIYQNRERSVFAYDLESNTYKGAPAEVKPFERGKRKAPLILDFGDAFFLDAFIRKNGLFAAMDAIGHSNPDTLKAMVFFYVLCPLSNRHAHDWWEGSYAKILYPNASLSSQRVSDFLAAAGDEYSQREFFREYFNLLEKSGSRTGNILIDSTGLPNSIHFPLTAISNHNGEVSSEVRLIYVVQQNTGLPIYFRYCPGNAVDATTLVRCLAELKEQGVNTKFAILDAGHYMEENINEFYASKVSFITRLKENLKLYKELVAEHLGALESRENLVEYNGRHVYLKRVACQLGGNSAYAYVGLDIDRKSSEARKTFQRAKGSKLTNSEVFDAIQKQGLFILVSSRRIALEKVLPLYYTRQQIEQVFDIGKNCADMLPLRVHTEETFRGHLLVTFIATVILKKLQDTLKNTPITPMSLFLNLRNQKCKVYQDKVITQEAFKKANDCYKLLGVKCPVSIPYKQVCG
ncbi:MAG: transposase [Clostridiales bacterium]|nr:transposase [Clostridiales bacterium]